MSYHYYFAMGFMLGVIITIMVSAIVGGTYSIGGDRIQATETVTINGKNYSVIPLDNGTLVHCVECIKMEMLKK